MSDAMMREAARLAGKSTVFADLSAVRLLRSVLTDDGAQVPSGTEGTIVGVWPGGQAYEVEFDVGLATVAAACLAAAPGRG